MPATKDPHMLFVEQFVTYHVFRSVKAIIDQDDFDLFKEVIRTFSNAPFFAGMEVMREFTKSKIYQHSDPRDPGVLDRLDEIAFEIDNHTKKTFSRILSLKEELGRMTDHGADSGTGAAPDAGLDLTQCLDRIYVCDLLWGTFFRIACYIVGKGDKYGKYLNELWYYDPYGPSAQSVNAPPVSKDVDWNSLYAVWQGHGGNSWNSDLDDAKSYEPHLYKYAVLHMLRKDKIWHVPAEADIAEWGLQGRDYALEYHHKTLYEMDTKPFLEALNSLAESKLLAEMLPDLDIGERISSVRKKLETFEKDKSHIISKLVARMPVDPEKIKEWQDNVRGAYAESTKADAVAQIKYDGQLCGSVSSLEDYHQRRSLVKTGNMLLDGKLGSSSAQAEFGKILQAVASNSACVQADEGLSSAIKSCVEKIRDGGRNPRVALISPDGMNRILETCPDALDTCGAPLRIVDSGAGGPEVLVLDPDCVEVTYKSKDKAGRLKLDVRGDGAGTKVTTMTSSICMDVKILDRGGMAKICPKAPLDPR